MNTISKSTHVFQVRMWSKKYYKTEGNQRKANIFDGIIIDEKSKKKIHFHSVGQLLTALEIMYKEHE